ncbi:uncharacterized protein LOC116199369 [Punica granatum]|uniref:Uncharacterized protein LOC116199369 n=2 Tax=Punica granatum TaxID=22663 RepID=A0A6P8D204_PUNGR|nr:uncharacterized protein LOC116199369 [Punica granatum]PKI52303.1 hypothetical protein CRG98_027229 [Punica granatum]
MASGAAATDGFLRCFYDGCLAGCDDAKERRPYHRNCGCALHKPRGDSPPCSHRFSSLSYPIRKSWSESCLSLMVSSLSSSSSPCSSSPSSSPAIQASATSRLVWCNFDGQLQEDKY